MIDYKKIIKSRRLRLAILNFLSFIPDEWMIKIQYRIKTGRKLNLQNPQRFTEKMQWYKLFYRDPLMKTCVDKYDVRGYIKSLGLEAILNECYGVFDNAEDVDFNQFPQKFVLKDTLGGGGTSVIICNNKTEANLKNYRVQMRRWIHSSTGKNFGREWVYENRKHRIIAEKFIDSIPEKGGLIDYKFMCFQGKVNFVIVLADRIMGVSAGCGLFDVDFNRLPCNELDETPLTRDVPKPSNYNEMIKIAEKISSRFPLVRVDLYNQNGAILFGEMTFFDSSGYQLYNPDSFDFELGKKFNLPDKINL
ncbi:teichuronopeptide biosynthesis TupA-like protein [Fibrobacter succinogenes subsp. elongatus]|uniref:TupA-like ATPgrasp n=2 Tax=Fibrobacter succinogenes TaxID=833 RepID=A0A380RUL2_FIBSU|nr:teichuronopeptide biosynthesis TupA-like protein [Fibrobacter succinogenes subsp. elongatus]SUQ19240.1 TupA-like ATPgrasp [Fibrobacter succinogenes]